MQIPSKLSYRALLNLVYSNCHRHHIAVNTRGADTVADLELDKAIHAPAGAPRVLNGPVGGRGPGCWCILAEHDCVVHLIAAFHVVRNHTLFVEEPAVTVDADICWFFYKEGVITNDMKCSNNMNHAVVLGKYTPATGTTPA